MVSEDLSLEERCERPAEPYLHRLMTTENILGLECAVNDVLAAAWQNGEIPLLRRCLCVPLFEASMVTVVDYPLDAREAEVVWKDLVFDNPAADAA